MANLTAIFLALVMAGAHGHGKEVTCNPEVPDEDCVATDLSLLQVPLGVTLTGERDVQNKEAHVSDHDAESGHGVSAMEQSHGSFFEQRRAPCPAQPDEKQQLQGEVLGALCERLGMANFLVFGTGFDSPFWHQSNPGGRTRFLEHHEEWISSQPPDIQASTMLVNYTSSMDKAEADLHDHNKTKLREFYDAQIPTDMKSLQWDQILVDSPEGVKKWSQTGKFLNSDWLSVIPEGAKMPMKRVFPFMHGRGQSIYAALLLRGPNTTVFVDDCDRELEMKYVSALLVDDKHQLTMHFNGHGGKTCQVSPINS